MRLTALLCSALLLLVGCATGGGVAADRGEIAKLSAPQPADVRAITYTPAPFVLASAGKIATGALFGIVGSAVAANSMQTAGEQMIATLGVADPAVVVRERLAATMTTTFGLHPTADTAPTSDALADLKSRFGASGAVLDTRTMGWQLIYYPADWGHFYLIYGGRARLTRLSDGKVLWEDRCVRKFPEEKPNRHTADDYRANNGELLKQRTQEAASGCADEMIARLEGRATAAK